MVMSDGVTVLINLCIYLSIVSILFFASVIIIILILTFLCSYRVVTLEAVAKVGPCYYRVLY